MNNTFDSYFDYSFDCNEYYVEENSRKCDNQVRAFNGGGSGG